MKKKDVIELYNHVKKKRLREKKATILKKSKKTGCTSCGRVTWKPGQ